MWIKWWRKATCVDSSLGSFSVFGSQHTRFFSTVIKGEKLMLEPDFISYMLVCLSVLQKTTFIHSHRLFLCKIYIFGAFLLILLHVKEYWLKTQPLMCWCTLSFVGHTHTYIQYTNCPGSECFGLYLTYSGVHTEKRCSCVSTLPSKKSGSTLRCEWRSALRSLTYTLAHSFTIHKRIFSLPFDVETPSTFPVNLRDFWA